MNIHANCLVIHPNMVFLTANNCCGILSDMSKVAIQRYTWMLHSVYKIWKKK